MFISGQIATIFAVFFPSACVILLGGRQPACVVCLGGRKKSAQILSTLQPEMNI